MSAAGCLPCRLHSFAEDQIPPPHSLTSLLLGSQFVPMTSSCLLWGLKLHCHQPPSSAWSATYCHWCCCYFCCCCWCKHPYMLSTCKGAPNFFFWWLLLEISKYTHAHQTHIYADARCEEAGKNKNGQVFSSRGKRTTKLFLTFLKDKPNSQPAIIISVVMIIINGNSSLSRITFVMVACRRLDG